MGCEAESDAGHSGGIHGDIGGYMGKMGMDVAARIFFENAGQSGGCQKTVGETRGVSGEHTGAADVGYPHFESGRRPDRVPNDLSCQPCQK